MLSLSKALLSPILDDEALTRGLGDPEARVLVEWLVDQAELIAGSADEEPARRTIGCLCRRARAIGRFVALWGQVGGRGAATQLAATERFTWPLPVGDCDPCELMLMVLRWEGSRPARAA